MQLNRAKEKVFLLNRLNILRPKEPMGSYSYRDKSLTFIIESNHKLVGVLKAFLRDYEDIVQELVGEVKIRIAERRSVNLGDLLFQKSAFSNVPLDLKESQKCPFNSCLTKQTMSLKPKIKIGGHAIKFDFKQYCGSSSVVYLAKCVQCKDPDKGYYFGQTINTLTSRCNGHREKFKTGKGQSVLSLHIMEKHPENF